MEGGGGEVGGGLRAVSGGLTEPVEKLVEVVSCLHPSSFRAGPGFVSADVPDTVLDISRTSHWPSLSLRSSLT